MATYDKRHSISMIAAAAVSGARLVTRGGAHATTSAEVVGISESAAALGKSFSSITFFSGLVEASEVIPDGSPIKPAADGSGRAAVGTDSDNCGWAVYGASKVGAVASVHVVEGRGSVLDAGIPAPLSMILLGDSKTRQCFETPSLYVSGYNAKWAPMGNAALGGPFNLIDGGVSGNTTAQALARLPALLAANPGPGWLVLRNMVNSIQSGNLVASNPIGNQVTKEMIVDDHAAEIALGKAAGKLIALCTDSGPGTGFAAPINAATAQGALMRNAFNYVNRWIRDQCAANGYVLVDIEAAIMDPATGLPVSGYIKADGVHVTYVGSCAEARAFVAGFAGRVAVPSRIANFRLSARNLLGPIASGKGAVTVDANNDTRIVTNAIGAATAAGGIPNGWAIALLRAGGVGAGSKVARAVTDLVPGAIAQIAVSSTASFGGAGFYIGGYPDGGGVGPNDTGSVLARWDQAWVINTGYAEGRRINANGCSYVCTAAGNTSNGADPTAGWSTQEGAIVTDNGATFICQRKPLAGESVQAVVDIAANTLVGNMSPRILLTYVDTAGTRYTTALLDLDLGAGDGIAGNYLAPTMSFVSLPLVLPNSNIRYLFVNVAAHGENGSSVNLQVLGAEAVNISQSA